MPVEEFTLNCSIDNKISAYVEKIASKP
jgi:hypothetical protein